MQLHEKSEKEQEVKIALKVLVADDDPPTRLLLRAAIAQWGYEAVVACDGEEAWQILQQPDPPKLLIVDWLMPKLEGTQLCSRIRKELSSHPFIILLTQVSGTQNIIKGLEAGADEFLSKPFNMAELRSRLSVGARIIKYENTLAEKNKQIKNQISQIETLEILAEKILQKNNSILKESSITNSTSIQQLTEIQQELTNLIAIIKKIQL